MSHSGDFGFKDNFMPKSLQTFHKTASESIVVAAFKIVGAKFAVNRAFFEHMVDDS